MLAPMMPPPIMTTSAVCAMHPRLPTHPDVMGNLRYRYPAVSDYAEHTTLCRLEVLSACLGRHHNTLISVPSLWTPRLPTATRHGCMVPVVSACISPEHQYNMAEKR